MKDLKIELKNTFTAYWEYLALNAACELELFDKILEHSLTLFELIEQNNWNEEATINLIDFCIKKEYISASTDKKLVLTDKGFLLAKNNPNGLYYACLHWADEHLNAWQSLSYTIKTGKSAFEKIYDEPLFDYLEKRPISSQNYQKAMNEYARDDYELIAQKIDFSNYKSIIDVGGGRGALIRQIKKENPTIKCHLFDLPSVINDLELEGIECIAGDFFENIPSGNDALILSRVLHDWNDKKAFQILKNCHKSLSKNGVIYIIEILSDRIKGIPNLLNLNMKLMCNSFERTFQTYQYLFRLAGFSVLEIVQLNDLQFIMKLKVYDSLEKHSIKRIRK